MALDHILTLDTVSAFAACSLPLATCGQQGSQCQQRRGACSFLGRPGAGRIGDLNDFYFIGSQVLRQAIAVAVDRLPGSGGLSISFN